MVTTFTAGTSEEGPPKRSKLELGRGLSKQLVASAFGWWIRVRQNVGLGYMHRLELGPGLGMMTKRFSDVEVLKWVPEELPRADLIDSAARTFVYDSGPTPE